MKTDPYTSSNPRRDAIHPPLSDKTVAIVGLGGAADIALDLLKSGMTRFRLFDPDALESGNLVRHACGSRYVGKNKAIATKLLLEEYAGRKLPDAVAVPKSVFDAEADFAASVRMSDLVVVGTDTDSSRAYANDLVVEFGKKAVFVSMFENGCGGEIFAYRPGNCCYGCLMRHQERSEFLIRFEARGAKSDCSSSRDVRGMPGLGTDQRFLSAIASRISLDLLLEGSRHSLPPIGANWVVFSVSGISEILEHPLSSLRFEISKHPDCPCAKNVS
ncbi:MAG: molybdopterin-synthase adenylyltransferase [Patescibacteria group bacterium]|nr:molybdopterin-synthase adenylyltransferase [Patescibacteria group bacterium]